MSSRMPNTILNFWGEKEGAMVEEVGFRRRMRGGHHTCLYFKEEDWQVLDSVRQGIHNGTLKHTSLSDFVQEAVRLLAKNLKIK